MAANYVLLEKITVGAAGASSVTFSGIPQTGYTDLVLKMSTRSTYPSGSSSIYLAPNGSSANGTTKTVYATSTAAGSGSYSVLIVRDTSNAGNTANTFGNAEVYIPNYASSNYKSMSSDGVAENNASTGSVNMGLNANLWSVTSAITSLTITTDNDFAQYSTFYLYGVAKLGTTPAIVPYATGGDTIMTDGTYWYHAFKSSGTFTPAKGLSCDVLVVAGGGSGGNSNNIYNTGGGGGAGGVYYSTGNAVSSAQTVTVGAGASGASAGIQGSNSIFGSLTAAVGGGGGGNYASGSVTGGSGGSGGGGSSLGNYAGGSATSGQGFAGGNGNTSRVGAGGGGAGAVGANSVAEPNGGNGGAGTNTYSTWLNTTGTGVSGYIAGGGGGGNSPAYGTPTGGVGGSGGGGSSSATSGTVGGSGVANTGGGGAAGTGNGGSPYYGGNGGSGLVIVRYAV